MVLDGETRATHAWGLLTLGLSAALALFLFQLAEGQQRPSHHYPWIWLAIYLCLAISAVGLFLMVAPVIRVLRRRTGERRRLITKTANATVIDPPSFSSELARFRRIDRNWNASDEAKALAEQWITDVYEKLNGWNQRQGERFITGSAMDAVGFKISRSLDGRRDVPSDPTLSRLHVHYDRLLKILDVSR